MAICNHDNVVEIVPLKCDPPPMPTCANGLKPVRVPDADNCCWHWECDCKAFSYLGDPPFFFVLVVARAASWGQTLIVKHLLKARHIVLGISQHPLCF
jgi:hypothetical protein